VGRIDHIEVRAVSRLFGHTVALRAVSARFDAGAISLIEGPNGAGKSTLLAVVGTLLRPTSGTVVYAPLGESAEAARPHIGWVAHDTRAYRDLSGRENVELAARLYGVDPTRAWPRVCERVDAGAFADKPVATLSRGQRQRIALARALVHSPSVLLLDEPMSGLDPASAERLESVLIEERDRGAVVVIVNHQSGLADRLGGKRVRLERGRLVEPAA
jgi:heme exporter protein A